MKLKPSINQFQAELILVWAPYFCLLEVEIAQEDKTWWFTDILKHSL